MMRVLAVTNMYPTPDRPYVGTFVGQQVEGLRRAGVEVDVLYLDRLRSGMCVYRQTGRLVRERLATFHPDIVHVMYGGVMAYLTGRVAGNLPVVITFHNSDVFGENLSGPIRKAISWIGVWCSRAAATRAQRIVLVSRHLEQAFPRGLDPSRTALIPCGIDLDRFRPMDRDSCRRQLGWDEGSFNVLFPANMGDPRKRLWLAEAALTRLQASGVPAVLRILQGVPYDDVPTWINASDVHILTSQEEGSPTTIKEALACDLPIVSVDVGDVVDQIENVAGCYIAASEPEELAAKLRLVYDGPRRIAGRNWAEEMSIERMAERLALLYDNCLLEIAR